MTRPWPIPPADSTLHCIGDTHFGSISADRAAKVMADINDSTMIGSVVAHVEFGDVTDHALEAEDALALTWFDQLPHPWYAAIGNHDMWEVRTAEEAATAFGLPGKDYAVDLPFGKLLVIGPDELAVDKTTMTYGATALGWLDAQLLAAAGDPCFIACHAPLQDTVGVGQPATEFSSAADAFSCQVDAEVRAVLADHSNVKAWISGHTHSPINTPDLVKAETIGGRTIAAINTSALVYTGIGSDATRKWSPLNTLYVTWLEDSIEVRFRNHGAGVWGDWSGAKIKTVTF